MSKWMSIPKKCTSNLGRVDFPVHCKLSSIIKSCTILERNLSPKGTRKIILTFDDGPSPLVSESLLDVLERQKVQAVFCYIGENLEKMPDVVSRAMQAGHLIAFHSYHHKLYNWRSQS
jgi:peptidoglycan/xylan/chitin deacetylase (PgdA/CDA1 family)